MLRTFDSSTMKEVSDEPPTDNTDNPPPLAPPTYVANPPALPPEPPRRRQRRSCDACRRSKRACDAEKNADFTGQPCSNCLRKNQACTFNWLKAAADSSQTRERKRQRSSTQSSNDGSEGSTTQHHGYEGREARAAAGSSRFEVADRRRRSDTSLTEEEDEEDGSNIVPTGDADHDATDFIRSDELVPVHARYSYRRGPFSSSSSQRSSFSSRFCGRRPMRDDAFPFHETFLGARSSRGFVTNGLLRIYNDSMENALSCWLTEHNCPYTLQKYKPAVLSAGKANREWGSSWGNRMYNRVIQLDRAYNSLRIRNLTAEEERTVSKALNMAVVAFASQWAQAGERGAQSRPTGFNFTTEEFPESNHFERSMQESLWHETSQILHRAAGIDSFRVVFAMIIFSLTQRPLDISRPFAHSTSKLRSKYEYFQNLIQDDDAPIFLELALRQMMAQRRTLERARQDMPRQANGEPQDPLRKEDRDTFNLLYWLGVMFDTISAAVSDRTVVVDDEDCELPRPENPDDTPSSSTAFPAAPTDWPMIPGMYTNQIQPSFSTDIDAAAAAAASSSDAKAQQNPEDHKVWGNLFMRDANSQADPKATRWPCSYKVAAATLSSAAPVKVLLYRRVAQIQTLVSRRAPPSRIESAINAAFHVHNHWTRIYAPFLSDCVAHHATLPPRIQSWYILLAGHWHLGVFLLSDLLAAVDDDTATGLSLPRERAARRASHLVATLRRQNALAVADLSLASIHCATAGRIRDAGQAEFHFAMSQAALLTEPWTVIFVRSLCRAGYTLVLLAGSAEAPPEERALARARCADCVEGLWYLGRKSDMAFLAARCLSSMLDEVASESGTVAQGSRRESTGEEEEEVEEDEEEAEEEEQAREDNVSGGEFHQQSPGTGAGAAELAQFQPTTVPDCTSFLHDWSIGDVMGDDPVAAGASTAPAAGLGFQDADDQMPLQDCDAMSFEPPLDLDVSGTWDFNLHP